MYDAWNACGEGNWSESKFYLSVRNRFTKKRKGVRKWLLPKEIDAIFGHNVAEEIRTRKLMVPELKQKETRFHPELPDVEAKLHEQASMSSN